MFTEIYGLGHIGILSLLHLANQGYRVRGVDIDSSKIIAIKQEKSTHIESELTHLIKSDEIQSRIMADRPDGVKHLNYLICVGTPSLESGPVDLSYVEKCLEDIARNHPDDLSATFILRSTVPPGTSQKLIETLQKRLKRPFDFIFFPEFIRTGQSWKDLNEPSLFVYSATEGANLELIKSFPGFEKSTQLKFSSCEYLKYLNNSWHALKVAFANEAAAIGKAHSVEVQEVFNAFLSDEKLNLGPKYLRPGAPYGGPCLKKEVEALSNLALEKNVSAPLIAQIDASNELRVRELVDGLEIEECRRIFLLGSGFRPGTFDERNSIPLKVFQLLKLKFRNAVGEIVCETPQQLKKGDLLIVGSLGIKQSESQKLIREGATILDLGLCAIHGSTSK